MTTSVNTLQNNATVVVVGAGPAGMSAALWLKHLGLQPLILEKESQPGGMQRFNFLHNEWVLGQQNMTGVQVGEHFFQHILDEDIECRCGVSIHRIDRDNNEIVITYLNDAGVEVSLCCGAVLVATGTRFLGSEILPVSAESVKDKHQVIVEGPYAFLEMESIANQRVAIIGAGDNAFENALRLLKNNCDVFLLARSQPSAQKKFLDEVISHPLFTLYQSVRMNSVDIIPGGVSLRFSIPTPVHLDVDRLHVLAGYQPNSRELSQVFGAELQCDAKAFVLVDAEGRTTIPGVYAAGDICNPAFPSVVSALASGALAAKTISRDFSASSHS